MKRFCTYLAATSIAMCVWPNLGFAQDDEPAKATSADTQVATEVDSEDPSGRPPGVFTYRIWGQLADTPEFAGGEGERQALSQLVRGRIGIEGDKYLLFSEIDILAGHLAGDPMPAVPEEADSGTQPRRDLLETGRLAELRQFYGQWTSPVGQLAGGLRLSQWGLGILANNGSLDSEGVFNQHFGGDRVLRATFATAPLRPLMDGAFAKDLYLAVGGDLVYRDENADLLAGDQAWQGVLAALYDTEQTKGGTYIVYRDQTDRDGDFLQITAVDLYGDHVWELGDDWAVRTAAEAAYLVGQTNRTLTSSGGEPVGVMGLGAAAETGLEYRPASLELELLAGYASGDANSSDDTQYRFRFDPNYNVGLVLFDHYLPAVTRASLDAIDDPARSGGPPKGAGGLINDGGIENAWYLAPRLVWGSQDSWLAGVGLLWAQANQPVADPYQSFVNGGVPTGLNGAPASTDLGWELDTALQYRFEPIDRLQIEAKGEWGLLFPGEAFESASGDPASPQSLARLRMSVIW